MNTKSFWIPISALMFAAGLLLATRAEWATYLGFFLLAEAVLFALAFLVAAVFGGAPSITLGFSLGFGLAIASTVLLGEDCEEDSFFLCITPTGAFFVGLVAALILCPGWALGTRAGALKRRGTLRSKQ